MNMVKENFEKRVYGEYEYDKMEIFTLKDGGQIQVHFKGSIFRNPSDTNSAPLLFVMPGLTSHSQSGYVRNMVDTAHSQGYQVILISYRGIGIPFTTPSLYCGNSIDDIYEPMKAMSQRYGQDSQGNKRKVFAIGASLGGTLLANALGDYADEHLLDAACVVNTPLKVWEMTDFLKTSMNGAYNLHMSRGMSKLVESNFPLLDAHFKKELGIDLREALNKVKEEKSQLVFDDLITAPFFGRKGHLDLYRWTACYYRIPKIQTPTMFMSNLDDPILGEQSIDYEMVRNNPNCVLATNRIGGHLGYHSSLFSLDVWFMQPVLSFLESQRDD
uniref:AB hydrolase-1 domain-containing protein n=1 Tax=Strombidium inclinatum TaxID=197538 RepID=A0A7S3IXJ0_9SPIT|mmetsp:Transcript_41963/g.64249  ORF Transcript_41963/g.64249 Transcript_41963/m.64249 type:complete len:329 (+) Transcript_41963:180-1166(+)